MTQIVQWPDPRLATVCEPVAQGENCRDLVERMFAIIEQSANGIGLAAPQIGVMKRVIVCRVPFKHFGGTQIIKHALTNPVLTWAKGPMVEGWEGCLSFPDHQVSIPRYPRIQVSGFNLRWEWTVIGAKGLVARVLQHEINHLDGKTIAYYAKMAYEVEQQKKREEQQLTLPLEQSGPG